MKITKIQTWLVRPRWAFIEISTDAGISGWGEPVLEGRAATVCECIHEMEPYLIGADPMKIEDLWTVLFRGGFYRGGGILMSAISGIDQALWDIKGKYFRVPIYKLLGGKRRDNLRTYASQLQFGWGDVCRDSVEMSAPHNAATIADYVENARKAVAEGYDCIKIDFFTFAPEDGHRYTDEDRTRLLPPEKVHMIEERVAAVREAIGPDVDIIMENHSYLDAQSAVQLGRAVQKYNIFYFEEPNTPNPKTAKFISSKLSMPIAHGERVYSRWQYAPFFEDQSIQVIQPDLGNCGGLTEGKKICDMAYVYDISVQAHVCASPLSTAVALHLESVIPNFVIHEHHTNNLKPWNKELCTVDWQPVDGKFKVPEGPGLGCEFTDKVLNTENKIIVK